MISIRAMNLADVPLGMRLKEQAGWNQLEADWIRFIEMEPEGCFVAELDGRPAGTTTTCLFGPVAWIGMVLVDPAVRKGGIGTALMEHALSFLEQRQIATVRLDATPLGQPIYERLGFVTQYELARYGGVPVATGQVPEARRARLDDLEQIIAFDYAVTATDRRKLIGRLFAERSAMVRVIERDGRIAGYRMARPGARAWQIGPCIAAPKVATLLLSEACHELAGQSVFVDIPLENAAAISLAQSLGLTEQRRLTRMCRGAEVSERIDPLWCSSGPEKG